MPITLRTYRGFVDHSLTIKVLCVTMNTKFEFATVEAKTLEVKMLLEAKDLDLEEMKKRLKDQEKEKQSELLKIQMEVRCVDI